MRLENLQDEDMRQAFLDAQVTVAREDALPADVKERNRRRKLRWFDSE